MSFFQDSIFLDDDFLDKICAQQEREVYARIIAFDINEIPIDQIEGKVTTGSINIDGNSAVRRTCSLTMIKEDIDINEYYWGIKTKFKLEIGLKNKINKDYPDIIWFSQGYYVISSFNTSLSISASSYTLAISSSLCVISVKNVSYLSTFLPKQNAFATTTHTDIKVKIKTADIIL